MHAAGPQCVESIRWSLPSSTCAGGILWQTVVFKQHASFGYGKHSLAMGDGVEFDGLGS
jgi:hypothetical protein